MNFRRCRHRLAFTLVELLVAITVIVILGAIAIGALSGVQNAAARNRAKGEIAALSTAIESYKLDNGGYPTSNIVWPSPTASYSDNSYKAASRVLFIRLSGRSYLGGPQVDGGAKVYMNTIREGMVGGTGASKDYFIDPWGNPYGYTPNGPTSGYNAGFFDLWTTGGKTGSTASDTNAWIVNWPDTVRESVSN
jgi:general secretion pathway protein G